MSLEKSKLKLQRIKNSTTILHPESGLILRTAKDKTVVGRLENGNVIELDKLAVELSLKWNFKYDETLLINDQESIGEGEEEEGDEEEGGEEDGDEEEGDEEEEGEENEYVEGKEDAEEDVEGEGEGEGGVEGEGGEKEDVEVKGGVEVEVEGKVEKEEGEKEYGSVEKEDDGDSKVLENNIMDITDNYSKQIFKCFDSIHKNYLDKIYKLEDQISKRDNEIVKITSKYNNEISKITSEYNNEVENHKNTTEKLNKLTIKFEGIKSLFS